MSQHTELVEHVAQTIADAAGDIYWAVERARPFDYHALARECLEALSVNPLREAAEKVISTWRDDSTYEEHGRAMDDLCKALGEQQP